MNSSKVFLYIVFAISFLHIGISFGRPLHEDALRLKEILKIALKLDDCSRRIHVQEPIPLRFRRANTRDRFPCTIKGF